MSARRFVVTRLFCDNHGTSAIEYALIVLLIALGVIAALQTIGSTVSTFFTSAGSAL